MARMMTHQTEKQRKNPAADRPVDAVQAAPIFGLRYIEEEATEIHDVVGCRMSTRTVTHCDDADALA
jgi:hypothetical protein